MSTTQCPTAVRLAAFQSGKLPREELETIAEHLGNCTSCSTALEKVSPPVDSLVRELREPPAPDGFCDEPDCQVVIARIEAVASGEATRTRDDTADNAPPGVLTQKILGKYQLLEPIGQGGMGTVYRAIHTLLKRTVAIKVLPPNRLKDAASVSRFRREIEAAGRLDHPHIVRTSDADEANGQHFLVMEWLPGQDLARHVRENGPLPVDKACDFIRQAALGLGYAHDHGMVHRDVKPSNIILTQDSDGRPAIKLLDLGLALLQDNAAAESELTRAGQVMGTYDYIAPEQAMESHAVDGRADIYSLGCTFYFLLTGKAPFHGKSEAKKLIAHQLEEPAPIAQFRNDVPREVVGIIGKMMAKDPDRRIRSMAEVADRLSPRDQPAPTRAPRRGLAIAGLVVLGVLLVGAVTFGIVRIATAEGDFVIETDDPKIKLSVTQGVVRLHDETTNRKYEVNAVRKANGEYDLDVRDIDADLAFTTQTLTIRRGERLALSAKFERKLPAGGVPPGPAAKKNEGKQPEGPLEKPAPVGEIRRYLGHAAGIACITPSPDGKSFVAGASGELWLWDLDGSSERVRFPNTQGNIQSAVFSADGQRVIGPAQVGSVVVWDAKTRAGEKPAELARFKIASWIEWLGVSPDRPHVYYTCRGGGRGYDLEKKSDLPLRFLGELASLSRDGRRLLSGDGRTLFLWDVETGKELSNVELPGAPVRIALAADGRHALASVANNVYQWDMTDKKSGKTLETPSSVHSLAIAPDGKRALTGGFDKKLRLWDLQSGTEIYCFEGHTAGVSSVAFISNTQALSGSADKTIRLWQLPAPATASSEPRSVPEAREVGEIRAYLGHSGLVQSVAFAPDGKSFLSGADAEIFHWDIDRAKEKRQFVDSMKPLRTARARDFIRRIAFTNDGKQCVSGGDDQIVRVWDVEKGEVLKRLEVPRAFPPASHHVALSPDNKLLLVAPAPTFARLYAFPSLEENAERFGGTEGHFSHDGSKVLTLEGNLLQLYQLSPLKRTFVEVKEIHHCALAPDGRFAVAGGLDAIVYVWDMVEKKIVHKMAGHKGTIQAVAISPDGTRALSGGGDNTVRLWDLKSGKELHTFEGHRAPVAGVAFSPDGGRAISAGGSDRSVRLWQLPEFARPD